MLATARYQNWKLLERMQPRVTGSVATTTPKNDLHWPLAPNAKCQRNVTTSRDSHLQIMAFERCQGYDPFDGPSPEGSNRTQTSGVATATPENARVGPHRGQHQWRGLEPFKESQSFIPRNWLLALI